MSILRRPIPAAKWRWKWARRSSQSGLSGRPLPWAGMRVGGSPVGTSFFSWMAIRSWDPAFVSDSWHDFASDTAVVFGHRREIHPEASIFNRVLDLDWMSAVGSVDACGGDALMRREALVAINGYDETLIAGEEPEMCRRMRERGWKILHADRPMTGHDLAMTRWSQYWRRAMRTGYAYAEVSQRFRGSRLPFWELEARHNRSRALAHIGILTLGLLSSLIWRSGWPVALLLIFYLCARSQDRKQS